MQTIQLYLICMLLSNKLYTCSFFTFWLNISLKCKENCHYLHGTAIKGFHHALELDMYRGTAIQFNFCKNSMFIWMH